jgi:hypothetical protein
MPLVLCRACSVFGHFPKFVEWSQGTKQRVHPRRLWLPPVKVYLKARIYERWASNRFKTQTCSWSRPVRARLKPDMESTVSRDLGIRRREAVARQHKTLRFMLRTMSRPQ